MTYYIAQNQPGGLPQKFPFEVPISGDVTIAFSGSCGAKFAAAFCGVTVYLDDTKLGEAALFSNAATPNSPLPTQFFAANLGFGPHTITLRPLTDETVSDKNDVFSLWIVD